MSLADDPRVLRALTGPLRTLEHHDRVTSTNDVALERLREGPPGLVVVADAQTAGRGRAGRAWTDDLRGPDGPANLAVSTTWDTPGSGAELLPLAAGLAVVDAAAAVGITGSLKWPNDVLLGREPDERKAAGILVERHTVGGRDVAVIGCGLDVDWRGLEREGDAAAWTSFAEAAGGSIDRGEVLAALLEGLQRWVVAVSSDADALLRAYGAACVTVGRDVVTTWPDGRSVSGRAVELDGSGRLVIETGRERVVVRSGDIEHVRASGSRRDPG